MLPLRMLRQARKIVGGLLVLVCLTPLAVSAQSTDLGELRIRLPSRAVAPTGTFLVRLDVPPLTDADLPAAAIPLHTRYGAARTALLEARSAATEAQRAAVVSTRDALVASLVASIDTLSRPALLRLGMLQHEIAASTASVAHGACTSDPRADCPPEPEVSDTVALATWARVTGGDVLAAHALYQRAESLAEANDDAAAGPLLVTVLGIAGLPHDLEAAASLLLGTVTSIASAADVATSYGRCAALGVAGVSPRCALSAGRELVRLGDLDAALVALGPALSTADSIGDEARALAATELARLGGGASSRLPAVLPTADRAAVLDVLAATLHDAGHLAWSLEALLAAQTLAADTARATRITTLEAERSAAHETAEAWLRRASAFCLDGVTQRATFTIRVRLGAAAPVVTITPGTGSRPVARALGTCLAERGPAPEGTPRGAYSAQVTLLGG